MLIAQCYKETAIELNVQSGIQTAVRPLFAGCSIDVSSIDYQVSVGINAVPFLAQARINLNGSAIDRNDREIVLIGVDPIILR